MMKHKKWPASYTFYAIAFIAIWVVIGTVGALSENYIRLSEGLIRGVLSLTVAVIAVYEGYKVERDENDDN